MVALTVGEVGSRTTPRDPAVITPGAIVIGGTADPPAVAEVVDVVNKAAGTVVHLRLLPGAVSDDAAANPAIGDRRTWSPQAASEKWHEVGRDEFRRGGSSDLP